ncbi:putative gamma-tubulin complex component protein [Dioscorea sansibarensis]
MEVSQSFISKLHCSISKGLPHAEPVSTFRTDEHELVRGVLQMLQGFASSLFYWDREQHSFFVKHGIFVSHLSQTSLSSILNRFLFIGTCLKKVEIFTKKAKASNQRAPTLEAFTDSVFLWLKKLRDVALGEENFVGSDSGTTITLQGLTDSLSRLLSGAECLFKIVYGAIPSAYFDTETPIPASEIAVHILDHLFEELNKVCLIQDGEEEPYHMVLAMFAGSLLPYLNGLDSWLYEGVLDDPYEEMFFSANDSVTIDQPSFWEKSYLFRPRKWRKPTSSVSILPNIGDITVETSDQKQSSLSGSGRGRDQLDMDIVVCPLFLKERARVIVSAGKSLQLVRHVPNEHAGLSNKAYGNVLNDFGAINYKNIGHASITPGESGNSCSSKSKDERLENVNSGEENHSRFHRNSPILDELSLSEVFMLCLSGLICGDKHVHDYFEMSYPEIAEVCKAFVDRTVQNAPSSLDCEKSWLKFLADVISRTSFVSVDSEIYPGGVTNQDCSVGVNTKRHHNPTCPDFITACISGTTLSHSFCPESPVITVCREFLKRNSTSWNNLNISRNFHLPPLNDEKLRETIFGEKCINASVSMDLIQQCVLPRLNGTDYTFGFQYGEFGRFHLEDEAKTMETLFPFPTLLPCLKEDLPISELLPSQKNSTLASSILNWIQNIKPNETLLPAVIIQECLSVYINKQVDHVGKHILSKLMSDWKLMDELCVLRAIFLLGSGDLLQQFLTVIFDKLDKGDSWDDDFELNTILQSIRNSADGSLLSASDSLVVSIGKNYSSDDEDHATGNLSTPRKIRNSCFGVDALDVLKFSYKVSWPLDLIADTEAINKYNQVMGFLLKVKRAKFVLDKARRWMWKGRGGMTHNYKRHLLVEQKLLHFVDAFHQYVMDRVFHSSWIELCSGMATAGSLDEVIEVHEAYLLSVQRQCFVAPDKLWALIASRIKSILGLALDFYSIQQTLSSGGAAPAIKARCEMEVDRIEKQFDDCIAFLLRILSFKLNVGHFPHLADLVTRINYNYFYMSDNGNLLTVPSFKSSTTKLSKTPATRTD